MSNYKLKRGVNPIADATFTEASKEELRVLIAICFSQGISEKDIPSAAAVSASRAKSAVALWLAEGIIEECGSETVTEEFADRLHPGELIEASAKEVAESIRDEGLSELIAECSSLFKKPALTTEEVKCITGLVVQYSLTPDYILTLAAHLSEKRPSTAAVLRDKAIALASKGIDTTEALEIYLKEKEHANSNIYEMRRIIGVWDRNFSGSEEAMIRKWFDTFAYSPVIVSEAYDICVMNTGSLSFGYMDKIISAWHEAGCKTLEECKAKRAVDKAETSSSQSQKRGRSKSDPPKPRYGDFDISDAFAKALARSYEEN